MKIPTQIVLAPDYIVTVKLLPWAEINPPDSGDETEGYWDKDEMTICIAKDLSEGEQLYTLLHEQVHAALDCMDYHLASWKARAKQMPTLRKRKSRLPRAVSEKVNSPNDGNNPSQDNRPVPAKEGE